MLISLLRCYRCYHGANPGNYGESMSWPPHVTVATVVQRDDTFLLVEEHDADLTVYNQPAGHLDPGENLFEAAVRETLEETGWVVELTGFIGLYQYYSAHNDTTYLRVCFAADPVRQETTELDPDIIAAHWLTLADLDKLPMRSPLVQQCLHDATARPTLPLDLVQHVV
jgi:8-oxo-dGTP pyrophosphatase MutT (NUDIX family)